MHKETKSYSAATVWPACGFLGGALAGVMDTSWTIASSDGGSNVATSVRLVFVGAGVTAAVGVLLGLLIGALAWTARRSPRLARFAARRLRLSVDAMLAALVTAPVVFYDAFALFHGPRAAQIPGRTVLSLALFSGGTVAVYVAASAYQRLVGKGNRWRWGVTGLLVLVAAVVHHADREFLPRLYPWFHATLAGLTLLLVILATRLAVANLHEASASPVTHKGRLRATVTVLALSLGGMGGSLWLLRHSHALRFASYEGTRLTAWVLQAVPPSLVSSAAAAVGWHDEGVAPTLLPPGPRRYGADIVLITVDALRADRVGAYGYQRGITPNIDRLARRATRFERAYAQAPHTSFSVTSMLTGTYYPTLARRVPKQDPDSIAVVLRTHGWKTAAFYPPAIFFNDAPKLKTYADTHYGFEFVKFEYLDAHHRVDQVVAYFNQAKPKKAFVWAHFFEPHEPYETHPEFPLDGEDTDRYDSEIAHADAAIGRLLEWLEKNRPEAVVVLSADHGEEFDEHGGRYHGSTLYDEQVRVPLIMAIPGVASRVVSGPVELIDVMPTLLSLLDIPMPKYTRGTDLGPWLATAPAKDELLPPAFAEIEDKRMVVLGSEKLICDLNWGFCAYHDLAKDPREQHNAADERPERTAVLRHHLDHWLDDHARVEPHLGKGVANREGGPVPRAIERGRLGDLMVAPDLAALLARDSSNPIRREAAQLLATLPPRRETSEALANAAQDVDPVVADWASVATVRLGDRRNLERVRRLVQDTSSPSPLRVRGALALGSFGDRTSVPVLAEALDDCADIQVCRLVILQLGHLKDRRAVPALLQRLNEVQNRREMVEALGDIGDARAAAALVERLLGDEYVPVRVQAAVALAKLGDVSAIPSLKLAAMSDKEPTVVEAARGAVASLGARADLAATAATRRPPKRR